MTSSISYRKVGKAIKRYEKLGYSYVDTPWTVSEKAIRATLPTDRHGFSLISPLINGGRLVGSAEQGFIQLMIDQAIRPGRYVTAGPCFRDEPVVDDHHQYSFFKVELINLNYRVCGFNDDHVLGMARHAMDVVNHLYGRLPELKSTSEGYDLVVDEVEIGSYGIRTFAGFEWVYGTGLALPRTPQAMKVNV